MTYYDILGVPRYATLDQIRSAYREQIKFFHPDVFDGSPYVAEEKTRQLNDAYAILSSPQSRFEYDKSLYSNDKAYIDQLLQQASTSRKKATASEQSHKAALSDLQQKHAQELKHYSLVQKLLCVVCALIVVVSSLLVVYFRFFYSNSHVSDLESQVQTLTAELAAAQNSTDSSSSSARIAELEAQISTLKSDLQTARSESYANGHDAGYKDGYRMGQEDALNSHPLSLPSNGTILYQSSATTISDSSIIVHAPTTSNCVVKLKSVFSGSTVFAFFVRANNTVELPCPSGTFDVCFAYGTDWYGYDSLFGSKTKCEKDGNISFTSAGWEYTLYPVSNGNLSMPSMSLSDMLED